MVEASNIRALISKVRGEKRQRIRWMTAMSFVAVVGWGTFAYNAKSAAEDQHNLYHLLARLTSDHVKLVAECDDARTYLSAAREAFTKLSAQLDDAASERDHLRVRFATAREEIRLLKESTGSQLQASSKANAWRLRATDTPQSQAKKQAAQ